MKTKHHLHRANAPGALSLLGLGLAVFQAQERAAIERAEAQAARAVGLETLRQEPGYADYEGLHILWHPEFPSGLRLHCCDTPLYRLAIELPARLQAWNNGQPLDWTDYRYLADVLRELLADAKTRQERLNLGRALVWVEDAGERLENQ
ncbi:MAG: hypothetical protein ACRYFX_12895 [Janthinobacterium lividum]